MKLSAIKITSSPTEGKAKEALAYLRKLGAPNPLNHRQLVIDNKVLIEVSVFEGALCLDLVHALEPGGGKIGLETVLAAADKFGAAVMLFAKKVGKKGLSTSQLTQWYGRHGFVADKSGEMRRPAKE